jgi:uncharacterized membrane protein
MMGLGWLPPNQERNRRQQKEKRTGSTALDILEERYARGEISREGYLEMRDDLSQWYHRRASSIVRLPRF